MKAAQFKKKLQKQLRRWKRRSLTLGIGLLAIVMIWMGIYLPGKVQSLLSKEDPLAMETLQYMQDNRTLNTDRDNSKLWNQLNSSTKKHEVMIRKMYVCGLEEQHLGLLRSDEIYALINEHPSWNGHMDTKEKVWFDESISDLSPTCKQQAYMSLDKEGNLSLFDGPPKDEKVIKTFFQLDINSMESTLPDGALKHLYNGIRIQDMDEYNSVLSTFSDYAREG
ncbi:BofC C-terminal domain-containing protein [Paenibacillus pini]|uniref:BofC protein n=1 Tax=Paenibacillus pini JCM 16418 TaxID=1236976 RepID=W7YGN1_9BACL|nr:BofC C-terminal domain-containing protein [Paenibacillus pini]GAF06738.1 BofC protein [Paenibacillus pini JCM 16418]